jgi:hypothetical protein
VLKRSIYSWLAADILDFGISAEESRMAAGVMAQLGTSRFNFHEKW